MRSVIERMLGIDLNHLHFQEIRDFTKTPDQLIEYLRRLEHPSLQKDLLEMYIHKDLHIDLRSFIGQVVNGKVNKTEWKTGCIWVRSTSLKEQLELPLHLLLDGIGEEFRYFQRPVREAWLQNVDSIGAPAQVVIDAVVRQDTPSTVTQYYMDLSMLSEVKERARIVIVRRWIAQRIANYMRYKKRMFYPIEPKMLEEILPQEKWSTEAIKALQGLNKELNADIDWERSIPGFEGSDEWYV